MKQAFLALGGLCALGFGVAAALHAAPIVIALLASLAFACIAVWAAVAAMEIQAPNDLSEPRTQPHSSENITIPRSGAFGRLAGAVAVAFSLAALVPIVSLGRRPRRPDTAWEPGDRLVTPGGRPVRPDDIPVGGIETVFPRGHIGAPESAVVLIRVPHDAMRLPPERQSWVPRGNVAFSKICTHAGCPVAIYLKASYELYCPCHQSVFSVILAAKPVSGPATRALPQLPLAVDHEGFLIASGPFDSPVGPDDWSRPA